MHKLLMTFKADEKPPLAEVLEHTKERGCSLVRNTATTYGLRFESPKQRAAMQEKLLGIWKDAIYEEQDPQEPDEYDESQTQSGDSEPPSEPPTEPTDPDEDETE